MNYGTAAYRIEQAHRHLDNFEGQLFGVPDKADPKALDQLAERLGQLQIQVTRAAMYSRKTEEYRVKAEATVDALIARAA